MRFCFCCSQLISNPYYEMGLEFCREFARLGMPMEMWNHTERTAGGGWAVDYYDGVFLADNGAHAEWSHNVRGWSSSKFTIFRCHDVGVTNSPDITTGEFIAMGEDVNLVCFTHDWIHEVFGVRYGDSHDSRTVTLVHGVPFDPIRIPAKENPYPAGPINLVWYGEVSPRVNDKLRHLMNVLPQPDYELHIVTTTADAMAETLPGNHHYCANIPRREFSHYLYYADYGLDMIGLDGSLKAHRKPFDYLAAGLPVIYEAAHGDWITREMRHGIEAPRNVEEFASVIINNTKRTWDRARCRRLMQERHTWTHRARQLYKRITEMIQ